MGASPSAGRSPPSLGASAVAAVRASVVPVCLIAPPLSFLPSFSPRPLALRRRGAEFLRSATVAPRPQRVFRRCPRYGRGDVRLPPGRTSVGARPPHCGRLGCCSAALAGARALPAVAAAACRRDGAFRCRVGALHSRNNAAARQRCLPSCGQRCLCGGACFYWCSVARLSAGGCRRAAELPKLSLVVVGASGGRGAPPSLPFPVASLLRCPRVCRCGAQQFFAPSASSCCGAFPTFWVLLLGLLQYYPAFFLSVFFFLPLAGSSIKLSPIFLEVLTNVAGCSVLLLLLLLWMTANRPARLLVPARCPNFAAVSGEFFLLFLALHAPLSVVAAGYVSATVPAQDVFRVEFSGSEWPYVYETLLQHSSAPAGQRTVSTLINPVAAAVADLLMASLSAPPGVTGLSVRGCHFGPGEGLAVVYAVTRFEGGGELTDDEISALVRRADTSYLQSLYWQNGGRATEAIVVREAAPDTPREKCDLGCRYAVGIALPVLCCAVMCIPIFISLVSPRRTSLKLDPPPPPPACAQVCCSRHAATLTSSYRLSGAAAPSEPDDGPVASAADAMEGYPAGYRVPEEAAETDDAYYTRVAQQAFEAERKRREDENRWRRANGLPLLTELRESAKKPRVLVVEDRQETVQSTLMDLDPEERAKLEHAPPQETEEEEEQQQQEVSPALDAPQRGGVADDAVAPQGAQGFYATASSLDPYRPNRKPFVPSSTVASARVVEVRHDPPHSPSLLSVPAPLTGGSAGQDAPATSPHTPPPTALPPGEPEAGTTPLSVVERRKMPLRDTGLIGGEILARAPSAAEARGSKGSSGSSLRWPLSKESRSGTPDSNAK
ncbi:uncharacterized protein Tco025E_03349 [Trypanosoma conorhini]|uniref:Uncharacterized protein n=2 Tax=Trypanosoma conorhini TaxID=83891 RepID=A0A422PV63_9TRYP|nr:uncharacterized protein Tco025E_03349 [Trypanosoma conorhini]RNF21613.1 hypothetical protein Tco025E_03349 [Trypanosoma conorhini]